MNQVNNERQDLEQLTIEYNAYFYPDNSEKAKHHLVEIYHDFNQNVELVEYLLEYCAANKKNTLNQLINIAQNWQEWGITSREEAEKYLETPYVIHSKYLELTGRNKKDRPYNIVKEELEYITTWLYEWDFSPVMIEKAFYITNKREITNISYTDGILKNWLRRGIKTPDQLNEYNKEYYKKYKEEDKTIEKDNEKYIFSSDEYYGITIEEYGCGFDLISLLDHETTVNIINKIIKFSKKSEKYAENVIPEIINEKLGYTDNYIDKEYLMYVYKNWDIVQRVNFYLEKYIKKYQGYIQTISRPMKNEFYI